MLKREQLTGKSFDELVKIAMWQVEQVNLIRGYESGLTKKHMYIFDQETLINLILKEDKTFKLSTNLVV